LHSGF